MNKIELFNMSTAFRGETAIYGYTFGSGQKAAAIVGSMRGNEFQQLYICSQLSKRLAELEESGSIVNGKEILVVPSLNYSAHNVYHKYWLADDTDINRQFPGNPDGIATSRIAYHVLDKLVEYIYGVQFPSFYLDGEFIPHVRMMKTGMENERLGLANQFGLPFVMIGEVRSYDTLTLNYNWQISGTEAFSIYSGGTDRINEEYADLAVSSVLRFLSRMGIIKYNCQGGFMSTVMNEESMVNILADDAGFVRNLVKADMEVKKGDVMALIIDPMDGRIKSEIRAPFSGIIFYSQEHPLVAQNAVVFKMIKKLHK